MSFIRILCRVIANEVEYIKNLSMLTLNVSKNFEIHLNQFVNIDVTVVWNFWNGHFDWFDVVCGTQRQICTTINTNFVGDFFGIVCMTLQNNDFRRGKSQKITCLTWCVRCENKYALVWDVELNWCASFLNRYVLEGSGRFRVPFNRYRNYS